MPGLLRADRGLTIAEIADLTQSRLRQDASAGKRISNFAPLDTAGATDISFADEKHLAAIAGTRAGACFVAVRHIALAPPDLDILETEDPYKAFVVTARALFPGVAAPASMLETRGKAQGALVSASARLEAGVIVDPLAVIGPRAEIGGGTLISAGAVIGSDVCIGRHCCVGAGASIAHALIGDRVVVGPGARIGQDGFEFLPGPRGNLRVPHLRRVIIQDDVQIGANTTIDRGSTRDTVVGEGTKIDNLVQIAHNAWIGRHCLIAPHSGISDGMTLGDYAVVTATRQAGT